MKKTFLIIWFLGFFQMLSASAEPRVVPEYQKLQTKEGFDVYYFKGHLPLFRVLISLDQGAQNDAPGASGALSLAMASLLRGSKNFSESQIESYMDELAGGISDSISREETTFTINGLNRNVEKILDASFDLLSAPSFNEATFQRLLRTRLQGIEQLKESAPAIGDYILDQLILMGTPWERPLFGYASDLEKMKASYAKFTYELFLREAKPKLLVIGGQRPEEVLNPFLERFEKWRAGIKARKKINVSPKLTGGADHKPGVLEGIDSHTVVVIDRPGISDCHLSMGFVGPGMNTPDFFELEVAENILSGPFSSRFNQRVREEMGLSYSIAGVFEYAKSRGTYQVTSAGRTENAGPLVKEIRRVLNSFVYDHQVTDEELGKIKTYMKGSFDLFLQDRYNIAQMFFVTLLNGLPGDFLDIYKKRLDAVTPATLRAAVQRNFNLEGLRIVVVGDGKKIEASLKQAELKSVRKSLSDFL